MGEAARCSAQHCYGVGQPYGLEIRTCLTGASSKTVVLNVVLWFSLFVVMFAMFLQCYIPDSCLKKAGNYPALNICFQ